jgi:signal transduction histidine kinase
MKHQIEPFLTWIRKEGPEEEFKRLEVFASILGNTLKEVRRMQQDLRPSMLDDLGLLTTIGWLCRKFAEGHPDIRIDRNISIDEKEVPASLKLVIFRILQEALNNVAKHSKASLVRMSLTKAGKEIDLTILDNGEGFDVKGTPRHGLGLVSMRERAELSGGSFSIESSRGKGTTIRASWPI